MRERDMRLRVERFLQSRLRSMLIPATMGLGLAMGGCASDALTADDAGDNKDAAADIGPITKYMAPTKDAGQPIPLYSVAVPKEDGGLPLRYAAVMPDAGRDLGMVAVYSAPSLNPERT